MKYSSVITYCSHASDQEWKMERGCQLSSPNPATLFTHFFIAFSLILGEFFLQMISQLLTFFMVQKKWGFNPSSQVLENEACLSCLQGCLRGNHHLTWGPLVSPLFWSFNIIFLHLQGHFKQPHRDPASKRPRVGYITSTLAMIWVERIYQFFIKLQARSIVSSV